MPVSREAGRHGFEASPRFLPPGPACPRLCSLLPSPWARRSQQDPAPRVGTLPAHTHRLLPPAPQQTHPWSIWCPRHFPLSPAACASVTPSRKIPAPHKGREALSAPAGPSCQALMPGPSDSWPQEAFAPLQLPGSGGLHRYWHWTKCLPHLPHTVSSTTLTAEWTQSPG